MRDDAPIDAPAPRSPVLPIFAFFLLVGVAFAALATGMSWISKSTDIASPVTTALPEGDGADIAPAGSGHPAPSFRLASLDDGMMGPPDFPGDVVLVEFWATWCGPCRLQAKYLEEAHEKLHGKGVRFLALDVGEDEATVRRYVEKKPFPYPVLLDPDDTVGPRYKVYGLPTVMIVDRQGQVTYLETGVTPTAKLLKELKAAGAAA